MQVETGLRSASAGWVYRLLTYLPIGAYLGNGSGAPSLGESNLDGSPVPLGSTATHDPAPIAREVWVRWKSLEGGSAHPKPPQNTL